MTLATYARAVARTWFAVSGRAGVLSSRDFARIADWHARGIPVELVREVARSCAGTGGRARAPRSLAALAAQVEEAWAVIRDGRLASAGSVVAAAAPPGGAWRAARARLPADSPLARLLGTLLDRLACGEAPRALDDELDRELEAAAPPEQVERARAAVDRDLGDFAGRLGPADLRRVAARAQVDKLRRLLGLPRL